MRLFSAGYNGPRLCRGGQNSNDQGGSAFAEITTIPLTVSFFASGWKFNIFYTTEGVWFGCGENDKKQFGGSIGVTSTSVPVELPWLNQITPVYVACGDKFTSILTASGDLYAMGENCGSSITKLRLDHAIFTFACGTNSLVAVPRGKGIYHWQSMNNAESSFWNDDVQFIDCAAGKSHFVAISDRGLVYTWGKGKACGQGKRFRSNVPLLVNFAHQTSFVRCFAYNFSTFLIDSVGHLWACGLNDKGQLGLGALRKTNVFMIVKNNIRSQIVMMAIGDYMSYALDSTGTVYSCGDSSDSRLVRLVNESVPNYMFYKCCDAEDFHVDWISAGCSHVIFGIDMTYLIPHPVKKFSMNNIPKRIENIYFHEFSNSFSIDLSVYSFSSSGICIGDKICDSEKNTFLVVGFSGDNHQLIVVNKENEIVHISCSQKSSIWQSFSLQNRTSSSLLKNFQTRGGFTIALDVSNQACLAHGLIPGELVNGPFGNGEFLGTFGSAPWFKWEGEEATLCRFPSLKSMFTFLTLISPLDRNVTSLEIEDVTYPVETNPCQYMSSFGFKINDLVTDEIDYYWIVGQFAYFAVLRSVSTQTLKFIRIGSFNLVRRSDFNSVYVTKIGVDGEAYEIDVSCKEEDVLIPMDRVLTKKGFGFVVGKGSDCYYLTLDDLAVLNAGVVKISSENDCILIARYGLQYLKNEIDIGYHNTNSSYYSPGDVVNHQDIWFLLLGQKSSKVWRCWSVDNLEEKKQIDLELDEESDHIIFFSIYFQIKARIL